MGIRSLERSVAKSRMRCMGIGQVNKKMGFHLPNSKARRWHRTGSGRSKFYELYGPNGKYQPIWRRVLTGDLAADGYKYQMTIGQAIKARNIRKNAYKHRKLRRIEKA